MSGIISTLAGAPGAANTTGQFYTNAGNDLINSTGSPAAAMFGKLENAQLRPQFQQAINQAAAAAAAQGVTGSGSERANLGNVTAQDSATLAGAEAPLYSQALSQYGNIIGQMPGAQVNSYNQATDQFLQAVNDAAMFAGGTVIPGPGGGSSAAQTPGGMGSYSGGDYYTQSGVPYLP